MRITTALSSALFVALGSASAWASPTFPDSVKSDLNLSYSPACTLCHNNQSGGAGTATQPFAVSMKADGLISGDRPSVQMALTKMTSDKTDSDKGGVDDVTELKNGTNPNDPSDDHNQSNGTPTTASPAYGCGASAHIAPNPETEGWMVGGLAMAIGAFVLRRNRKR